jgi:hypothetical protein
MLTLCLQHLACMRHFVRLSAVPRRSAGGAALTRHYDRSVQRTPSACFLTLTPLALHWLQAHCPLVMHQRFEHQPHVQLVQIDWNAFAAQVWFITFYGGSGFIMPYYNVILQHDGYRYARRRTAALSQHCCCKSAVAPSSIFATCGDTLRFRFCSKVAAGKPA